MEGGNSGESDGNGNGASDFEEQYWCVALLYVRVQEIVC